MQSVLPKQSINDFVHGTTVSTIDLLCDCINGFGQ